MNTVVSIKNLALIKPIAIFVALHPSSSLSASYIHDQGRRSVEVGSVGLRITGSHESHDPADIRPDIGLLFVGVLS